MDFPDIDLNGLAAFDAIRRTRSVSQAAIELNLAQSTLSNRLRRMRAELGDPLFVKTGDGMLPTPFAEEIGLRIVDALALLEHGLKSKQSFDPARENRRFTILMADLSEVLLLPALLDRCKTEAPGMSFTSHALTDHETEEALRNGSADVAIGFFPEISTRLIQRLIMRADYACIAAQDHPTIGDAISRPQFLAARHAIAEAKGTGHHAIERALQGAGVAHQIGARVSGFLPLPMIVAASDLIATVPKPFAEMMAETVAIKILDHPLPLPTLEIRQFWHERYTDDPGNIWLRQVLGDLFKSIAAVSNAA